MKIIAFGDIHDRLDYLDHLHEEISNANIVIITGDLTEFGSIREAKIVLDRIRGINENVYAQCGNLDDPNVESFLAGEGISLHGRGYIIDSVGIFGVGGSNPTPFSTPNELSEETILEVINRGYSEVSDANYKILIPHMPPYNSKVDIVNNGAHVGSTSVRAFIEANQPDLCLAGHIHESAEEDHIGKTHILNPGPFFEGGYISVEVDKKGIKAELRFLA